MNRRRPQKQCDSKSASSKRKRNFRFESLEERRVLTTMIAGDAHWNSHREYQPSDDQVVFRVGQQPLEIDVLGNDWKWTYDPAFSPIARSSNAEDFDELRESLSVSAAQNGTVELTESGEIIYRANPDFIGIDRFSYTTVHDGETVGADVYVNVVQSLYALRDWYAVDAGTENNLLDVLDNDGTRQETTLQFSNQELSIVSVNTDGLAGTVQLTADNRNLIYTAGENATGEQTFRYTIEDANGNQAEAVVYLEIASAANETDDSVSTRELEQRLLESAVDRYQHQFENPEGAYSPRYHIDAPFIDLPRWDFFDQSFEMNVLRLGQTNAVALSSAQDDDAASASLTNNQDARVDEADLVKTDGSYLYMVSNWTDDNGGEHHQLVITDVRDRTQMNVVARYALDGPVENLFLHDDRVTVLSQESLTINVTVLDVSDPTTPTLEFESEWGGQLSQARFVDNHVYVIAQTIGQEHLPTVETHCYQQDVGCFFETAGQYINRIESIVAEALNGTVTTTAADGSVTTVPIESVTSLAHTGTLHDFNTSAVLSFDVNSDAVGPTDSLSVAHGRGSQVYVSPQSIVFFETAHQSGDRTALIHLAPSLTSTVPLGFRGEAMTLIQQVSFDSDGELDWEAAGAVPGRALNTFSFSEHDGYFRVATTEQQSSSVYVLQQDGEQLEIVGAVQDLAPGEQIYSVRFEGNRGFVVTFRQVDPLFVIDLSDPTDPELLGELKVTGYSNYLQVLDENHLLGIGRDADEMGFFEELQVSIFDISDLENPTLKHRYSFEGGRELWSPLLQDARTLGSHQSVNYFAEHETLVLPVYSGSGGFWGWEHESHEQTLSMRVLDIDLSDGISELGRVDFEEWVDPQKLRAVRIEDDLLSVAPNVIKANKLRQPDQSLGQLLIGAGATDDVFVIRGKQTSTLNVMANDLMPEGEEHHIEIHPPAEGGVTRVDANGEITFTPDPEFLGTVEFSYSIDGGTAASVLVDVKPQWHNGERPLDVNDDGQATVRDLLQIINLLSEFGNGALSDYDQLASENAIDAVFADVNQDSQINPRDALSMINHFAEQSAATQSLANQSHDFREDRRDEAEAGESSDEAIGQLF